MADDVATGLGKMKLTSDEEEVIPISDERVIYFWHFRLSNIGLSRLYFIIS